MMGWWWHCDACEEKNSGIEASQKKIINFEEINQRVLKRVEAERAKETTPIDICKEQLNPFVSTDVHSEFYFGNALTERRGIFTD